MQRMHYKYFLSEEAEFDVFESYIWYEKQKEGLGEEFLDALDSAETSICNNPLTYPVRHKKIVRAFIVDRFPYIIYYVIKKDVIYVISIFNTNQKPKIWRNRLS